MRRPSLRHSAGLATAVLVLACQSAPQALGPLSDPREIVMAGVSSFARTQFVHAHADLAVGMAAQDVGAAQPMTAKVTLDADIDLARRALAARTMTSMGANFGADQVSEMILVDGQQFTRNPPDTRWTQFGMLGAQPTLPSNQEIADAINGSLDGAGVILRLADATPCGDGTCYHVVAELDPNAAWQLLGPLLGGGGGAMPPDLNLEPITVDVLVDQATRALMGLDLAVSILGTGTTTSAHLVLSDHDVPIAISAPPPNLVDRMDGGFGEGGGVVTMTAPPVPAPAESP